MNARSSVPPVACSLAVSPPLETRSSERAISRARATQKDNPASLPLQAAETVRGQTIQRGGRLPDEAPALHPEGRSAGYTGGPVDRNAAAQPRPTRGPLLPAGGAKHQRHEAPARRAGPLEDRASDIDRPGPSSAARLVQVARVPAQIIARHAERPYVATTRPGQGGRGPGEARTGAVVLADERLRERRRGEPGAVAGRA